MSLGYWEGEGWGLGVVAGAGLGVFGGWLSEECEAKVRKLSLNSSGFGSMDCRWACQTQFTDHGLAGAWNSNGRELPRQSEASLRTPSKMQES